MAEADKKKTTKKKSVKKSDKKEEKAKVVKPVVDSPVEKVVEKPVVAEKPVAEVVSPASPKPKPKKASKIILILGESYTSGQLGITFEKNVPYVTGNKEIIAFAKANPSRFRIE